VPFPGRKFIDIGGKFIDIDGAAEYCCTAFSRPFSRRPELPAADSLHLAT